MRFPNLILSTFLAGAALVLPTSRVIADQSKDDCAVHWALVALESRNPIADADAAIRRGSPQFLGVYGFALTSPGLSADPYCLRDSGLLSMLPDTGDVLRCEEHARLQEVARDYARAYNARLLAKKAIAIPPKCTA